MFTFTFQLIGIKKILIAYDTVCNSKTATKDMKLTIAVKSKLLKVTSIFGLFYAVLCGAAMLLAVAVPISRMYCFAFRILYLYYFYRFSLYIWIFI